MSFQCLGSWPGENGETYMSLLDTKLPQLGEEPRPRYRCAVSQFYVSFKRVAANWNVIKNKNIFSHKSAFKIL